MLGGEEEGVRLQGLKEEILTNINSYFNGRLEEDIDEKQLISNLEAVQKILNYEKLRFKALVEAKRLTELAPTSEEKEKQEQERKEKEKREQEKKEQEKKEEKETEKEKTEGDKKGEESNKPESTPAPSPASSSSPSSILPPEQEQGLKLFVVLASPMYSSNVGTIARLCRNFAVSRLIIVAPQCDILNEEALRYATHGAPYLYNALVVEDMKETLEMCDFLVGFSARVSGGGSSARALLRVPLSLRLFCKQLKTNDRTGSIGLVFGRESHGLTNEELSYCNFLVHIPINTSFPVLNLAQAVCIALYDVHLAITDTEEKKPLPSKKDKKKKKTQKGEKEGANEATKEEEEKEEKEEEDDWTLYSLANPQQSSQLMELWKHIIETLPLSSSQKTSAELSFSNVIGRSLVSEREASALLRVVRGLEKEIRK